MLRLPIEIQIKIMSYLLVQDLIKSQLPEDLYWRLYSIEWRRSWYERCSIYKKYEPGDTPRPPKMPIFASPLRWRRKLMLLEYCLREVAYIEDVMDRDLTVFYTDACYTSPLSLKCLETMPPSPIMCNVRRLSSH
ncbi:hypothetical protein DOLIC_00051 [Dolichomitus sp. PSUC_FEM 10030005]|nr:hypothetical protein [Dolichomitus sp. PSUC_FEM 10030005]